MTDNPIVEEVHKIREQMLAHHGGDLRALLRDAQRRTEAAGEAGRPVVVGRPRVAQRPPAPVKTEG
jgi:hypothetical protein